jgi:Ser/Thr protein kinase RdoA (MazF antagonist)
LEEEVDVELSSPIAYGRTAELYAWQPGWVLKLFYDWFEPDHIEYEARIARTLQASGLPIPAVGELVHVNGRHGLIYQRIEGDPMRQHLSRQPWRLLAYARRAAALHIQMHTHPAPADLPGQRRRLVSKIRQASLPATLRAKALAAIERLPENDRLCHGDFHPGNILMTAQGEIIIDWIDATRGNALADLARTSILLLGAMACQIRSARERMLVRLFHAAYRRYYFRSNPDGETEYRRWLPIVAAARLSENIIELDAWLTAQAEQGL